MKVIYIKETRDLEGKFYRTGDWGIKKHNMWDNGKTNWTTIKPPKESLSNDPIPCDWDEETQSWILDQDVLKEREISKASSEIMSDDIEAIWDLIGIENAPLDISKKYKEKKEVRSKNK
jgi:hypothetical protein